MTHIEQGSINYREGHAFENRVSEVYRLLHYNVDANREFDSRQIDLFLTGKLGDLTVHRAIECKLGPVRVEDLDSFLAKLQLVRRQYPAVVGTIVSGVSFSTSVKDHASSVGVTLITFRDLTAQVMDGHAYVHQLKEQLATNERYQPRRYVEPEVGYSSTGAAAPAFEVIDDWLSEAGWTQLTLLGDVGTGKSFLARMVAHRLADKFLSQPLENPMPIFVDLRNTDRQVSLEGLILTHFARAGLANLSFDAFLYGLSAGQVVLILDGFDEMAAKVAPDSTTRNFHELARAAVGRAKVLLTCRTHYFRSRAEEEEVILGQSQGYGSEAARELYWDLISRKGFKIAYLRPFGLKEITNFLTAVDAAKAKATTRRIQATYNLLELAQTPMLLDMIVRSLDALRGNSINRAELYAVFTDAWIHRDRWRGVLPPPTKLAFLTALARSLWLEDTATIHYLKLTAFLEQELADQVKDGRRWSEIEAEIRTATFLTRDDAGLYGLAHKSYAEYFLARYLASELRQGRIDCLKLRRLTAEVIGFLEEMAPPGLEDTLEDILRHGYQAQISENALVSLYSIRRNRALALLDENDAHRRQGITVELPKGMQLDTAQLQEITLQDAVMQGLNLRGADLRYSTITQCDCSHSDLSEARLDMANLIGSTFRSANLTGARLVGAILGDTDLTGAGLEGLDLGSHSLPGGRATLRDHHLSYTRHQVDAARKGYTVLGTKLQDFWQTITHHLVDIRREAKALVARHNRYDIDSDDLVSEALLRLASAAPQYLARMEDRDLSNLIRFEITTTLRRSTLSSRAHFSFSLSEPLSDSLPDRQAVNWPVRLDLHKALGTLPPPVARILVAYFYLGYTIKEIAERTGLSQRTISRRLAAGTSAIRHLLGGRLKGRAASAAAEPVPLHSSSGQADYQIHQKPTAGLPSSFSQD